MGRPKKYSDTELAQQRGVWSKQSNDRRRGQYAQDPTYRKRALRQARSSYRRNVASEIKNCAENAEKLSEFGQQRTVRILGVDQDLLTFTVAEVGMALGGYHPVAIRRWIAGDKFPEPPHEEQREGIRGARPRLYLESHVRAFIKVFADFQKEKQNLYATDTEIIKRLFDAV